MDITKRIGLAIKGMTPDIFFRAPAYAEYLNKMVSAVLARCFSEAGLKRRPTIKIWAVYEPDNPDTAATDGLSYIRINAGNKLIGACGSLKEQFEVSIGMTLHEVSHILYMDARGWGKIFDDLLDYGIMPEMGFEDPKMQASYAELCLLIKNAPKVRAALFKEFHWIVNALNDAVDEFLISECIGGYFTKCLFAMREEAFRQAKTMEEMLDGKEGTVADQELAMRRKNALLQQALWYAKYGKMKIEDPAEIEPGLMEDLERIEGLIREFHNSNVTEDMCRCAASIMSVLWPYYKEMMQPAQTSVPEAAEEGREEQDAEEKKEDDTHSEASPDGTAVDDKTILPESAAEEILRRLTEAQDRMEDEAGSPDVRECLPEGLLYDRMRDGQGEKHQGALKADCHDEGGDAMDMFARLRKDIAAEEAWAALETDETQELCSRMEKIEREIRSEDSYYDKPLVFKREKELPKAYESQYGLTYESVRKAAKACSRSLMREIKQRKSNAKLTGQYFGRLDRRHLYRDDGQVFYRNRIPLDDLNLAVCVVMDESGSMGMDNRIEAVQRMAVLVDAFVRELHIPCLMFGHTETDGKIMIFHYRDFDSENRRDSLRFMGMEARNSNEDGQVIAYGIHRMMERTERLKVMIVISDGLPHETKHMAETIRIGRKAGIKIIGAAIGEDAERIRHLYGGDSFLNITDLESLPKSMVSLIKRFIVI